MTGTDREKVGRRKQLRALIRVAKYRPALTAAIIIAGVFAASLEAVGLSFILPIVEIVQAPGDPAANADGLFGLFVRAYQAVGLTFTLGTVILGVSVVLTIRWTFTFVVRWLRGALQFDYTRELQSEAFGNALNARIEYFDNRGSDEILNAIVTQAEYAGRAIRRVVDFFEQAILSLMYLLIAFVLSPTLTVFAVVFLGGFSLLFRTIVESGYDIGDRVADANERVHQAAQAGTQGIRDTKLFGLKNELFDDFLEGVNQFARASIKQRRNQEAIQNFYNLLTAISVFLLIYLAITWANMSLGTLGVFLFAMFRLGPKASNLNSQLYRLENDLPHLVRTQRFIKELGHHGESETASIPAPDEVQNIVLDDIHFSYHGQEKEAINGITIEFEKGDYIGLVGQSGAGKSTIVSLLARLYEPDSGEILANDKQISEMPIQGWREKLAIVRQNPYIFNDTLKYNLTVGRRDVSDDHLAEVIEISKIDEFFDELPQGYETQLGDQGIRLSGGQRQRVALARALLKDADILVLDEATSDLDSGLEVEVQEAIEELECNYAMVGIAHRLSTVRNADMIYTIDSGEIIEAGRHEELMENDGKYADMFDLQRRESTPQ